MASLLKAVGNWFRAKKDSAAEKMADPIRDGKFAIEDSEKKIAEFTSQIAKLIAETKKLEKQKKGAEEDVAKWMNIAKKAATSGNEDDARTALENKTNADAQVASFTAEAAKNEQITKNLRNQLEKARKKVAKAKGDFVRLSARSEGAKVRKELAKATSDFNSGDSPLSALDDLSKSVDADESEAEAWEDLTGNPDADLADKYATSSSEVEDELAALMNSSKK